MAPQSLPSHLPRSGPLTIRQINWFILIPSIAYKASSHAAHQSWCTQLHANCNTVNPPGKCVGYQTTLLMSTTTSATSDFSDFDKSSLNRRPAQTAHTPAFTVPEKPQISARSDALELSRQEANELLRGSAFSEWKDNAAAGDNILESPEEMRRKDPLGTQIWKLYSKTKTRLPNQERLENLTWRMMAMNLKRREKL
jgi:hypothetical protein